MNAALRLRRIFRFLRGEQGLAAGEDLFESERKRQRGDTAGGDVGDALCGKDAASA